MISKTQERDDRKETCQPTKTHTRAGARLRDTHSGSRESAANFSNEPQGLENLLGFVVVARDVGREAL